MTVAAVAATGLAAHAAANPVRLPPPPTPLLEHVTVCVPARDEAHRLEPCLTALLEALRQCDGAAELVVLDDNSSDGTGCLARSLLAGQGRVVTGEPLPDGWLGKPHACAQLAAAADVSSTALVFVDADVVVAPDAILRAVALLRGADLALVSPYPRQRAVSPAERLVQPLLQWSWLTFLPLPLAERSRRPSLGAANGQLMVVDRETLEHAGGFAAVRDEVLDDLALLRALKRAGGRGGVADGTELAACRMYDGWPELRDGYGKSLWAAFGSPAGALGVTALQAFLYLLPPIAVLRRGTRTLGLLGYAGGVAGRAASAARTGGRVWPDSLAHPASVALFGYLTARSVVLRRLDRLTWKGRSL